MNSNQAVMRAEIGVRIEVGRGSSKRSNSNSFSVRRRTVHRIHAALALLATCSFTAGCHLHHHRLHPHGMPPGQAKKRGHWKAKHHHPVDTGVAIQVGVAR